MAGETLSFDIFARLREDGFAKAGKAASAATDDVLNLARRLDELSKKSATARVGLAGDKEALAQLDKLDLKLLTTGRRVVDPKISLDGAAKAQAEIAALEVSLGKLGAKSEDVTTSVGSGGLAGPAGMGALIAAGVALSPVIATVAVGVGAFGAAAAGAVGPIVKAAQATGGLKANMAKLDPEQQNLAKSILGLGKQYDVFQKALEPQVLAVFGKGIETAGHLLHDVQPIAAATGKALGGMLSAIDAEFQSGTWQKFFGFMAATAGPDIALITANFTDFLALLPPLLTDLQPLAVALLQVTDAALKTAGAIVQATGSVIKFTDAERRLASEAHNTGGFLGELVHAAERAAGNMIPGAAAGQKLAHAISASGDASAKAAAGLNIMAGEAAATATPVFNLTTALAGLTAAMQKNVDQVLTSQGDIIGWQQSLQAAEKQLESNSAGLRGNSKDALANKAALLQSTQQAQAFAEQQTHLGGNLHAASRVIQDQIHWLEVHAGKSKFAREEIRALRLEEDKIKALIRQKLLVSGQGTWQVLQAGALPGGTRQPGGPHPVAARGAYIRTGQPGVDDQLVIAQRGELIVPTPMVSAGLVDHLRGMIPGFAAGGTVGSYSGSVGGMPPWLARQEAATLRALDAATAAATAAGIRGAQAAASSGGGGVAGPGGGTAAQNMALARKLMPAWASGTEWADWAALWNRESGWSQYAYNASSGATGIPQSLPYSKMPRAAWLPSQGGSANVHAQETWGIGYIKGRYGDPIGAWNHELTHGWYADGGVVGGSKKRKPVDPQQRKWLDQLARDVKVLHADQDHAVKRRKVLRHSMEIDELWFLTHPNVKKHGIGFDEHERSLRRSRHALSSYNRRESDKEKALAAKIAILRDLTGHPKGRMYGGQGVPAPVDGGAGDGSGDPGSGDTGGGVTAPPAPSGPPPIPPPPMPAWMVAAGLGGGGGAGTGGGFTFPGQAGGGMSMPEPVTPGYYGGTRSMGGYGGSGMDFGAVIAEIRAMHQGIVGAVGMVAPGTARGFDRSMTGMSARVAGRFT